MGWMMHGLRSVRNILKQNQGVEEKPLLKEGRIPIDMYILNTNRVRIFSKDYRIKEPI